jgi:hypothetical protein
MFFTINLERDDRFECEAPAACERWPRLNDASLTTIKLVD